MPDSCKNFNYLLTPFKITKLSVLKSNSKAYLWICSLEI